VGVWVSGAAVSIGVVELVSELFSGLNSQNDY
jgi:hypothetical protein